MTSPSFWEGIPAGSREDYELWRDGNPNITAWTDLGPAARERWAAARRAIAPRPDQRTGRGERVSDEVWIWAAVIAACWIVAGLWYIAGMLDDRDKQERVDALMEKLDQAREREGR